MKHWLDWLFAPEQDKASTFLIAFNFIVIEAFIKSIYDLSVGAALKVIDRVGKSEISGKVKKRVFDGIQWVILILSILCFVAELFVVLYFIYQYVFTENA